MNGLKSYFCIYYSNLNWKGNSPAIREIIRTKVAVIYSSADDLAAGFSRSEISMNRARSKRYFIDFVFFIPKKYRHYFNLKPSQQEPYSGQSEVSCAVSRVIPSPEIICGPHLFEGTTSRSLCGEFRSGVRVYRGRAPREDENGLFVDVKLLLGS